MQVVGFADVQQVAAIVVEPVRAGHPGNPPQELAVESVTRPVDRLDPARRAVA